MRTRLLAVLVAAVLPVLVVASPALARDDGEVPGPSLGIGMTIVEFVVVPIGGFLLIAFFASLPSMLRRPRYRPGRPWKHDALWFGGPDDADAAVARARPGATAKGGASAEW